MRTVNYLLQKSSVRATGNIVNQRWFIGLYVLDSGSNISGRNIIIFWATPSRGTFTGPNEGHQGNALTEVLMGNRNTFLILNNIFHFLK